MNHSMEARRILVVDDDHTTLMMAERALAAAGFVVATLPSGFGLAVEIRRFEPDLVLLDVNMPGLRGDRASRLAAQLDPERRNPVHTVLFSGAGESELAQLSREIGALGWLRKPVAPKELVRRVKDLLTEHRSTRTG